VAERGAERHVALWRRSRLTGYRIDAPDLGDRSGALSLGRVVRVDSGMGSAFVAFDQSPSGEAETGLLPSRRGEKRVEGERLLVQVALDRRGDKSARLTAAAILEGRYVDLLSKESGVHMTGATLEPEMARALRASLRGLVADSSIGLRLTSRASGAPAESIVKEASGLLAGWQQVMAALDQATSPAGLQAPANAVLSFLREIPGGEAIILVADNRTLARRIENELVEASVGDMPTIEVLPQREWIPKATELDEAVRAALDPRVRLSDGGWLLFEPGETLTAIDVNSGTASNRRASATRADLRLKLNLQAVEAIAWQLRLRAIGGLVVIDFVDMESSADRDRVVKALRGACADDPARIRVLPMSDLGLVQMTRQRRGTPLVELFFGACEVCESTGRLAKRRPIGDGPL
jgi:Rne/Rng family ribonuclease